MDSGGRVSESTVIGILSPKTLFSGMIDKQYKFFGVSENLSRRL
jgi:hypothetical protein